jgi:hypothetical protein
MTTFGDFDDADAVDVEPVDAEQLARKLHAIRLARGLENKPWDELTGPQQALRLAIIAALLAWMRRQGSFA